MSYCSALNSTSSCIFLARYLIRLKRMLCGCFETEIVSQELSSLFTKFPRINLGTISCRLKNDVCSWPATTIVKDSLCISCYSHLIILSPLLVFMHASCGICHYISLLAEYHCHLHFYEVSSSVSIIRLFILLSEWDMLPAFIMQDMHYCWSILSCSLHDNQLKFKKCHIKFT